MQKLQRIETRIEQLSGLQKLVANQLLKINRLRTELMQVYLRVFELTK